MEAVNIKKMEPAHWEAVKEIYENGIATGHATFETKAPEWEKWDREHLKFARIVALVKDKVAGWAALSAVSGRCVYGGVAEISVYVAEGYRGLGIGKKLLENLIIQSEENGIWTLQAGIFPENTASLKLHEKAGFRIIGKREKIGKMNNVWRDSIILEKRSRIVGVDEKENTIKIPEQM
ncbi:N-acetyltransferase [Antarcticibacterium arcticum]|uniref:N-acetyltransferase n=1 Tax=Antarcticibacterium arcticum TaxID=2585771 RepID=A0A5B8YH24_9FLAO|nr:GNAT family N-acetyltransferase [Antarcticibacterium arcticum]QED36408.1 N-acetyltransferase [Antarcticibacterium arcticum]